MAVVYVKLHGFTENNRRSKIYLFCFGNMFCGDQRMKCLLHFLVTQYDIFKKNFMDILKKLHQIFLLFIRLFLRGCCLVLPLFLSAVLYSRRALFLL